MTHAWTGRVAFSFNYLPHLGTLDGLHYALGYSGTGVAMLWEGAHDGTDITFELGLLMSSSGPMRILS